MLPPQSGKERSSPHTWQHWLLSFLPLVFANFVMEKNSTLSLHFKLLSFLVRLDVFKEAHACSKLPSEVFILPQPCSITSRNSYLSQSVSSLKKKIKKSIGFIKTYLDAGFHICLDANERLHTWLFYALNRATSIWILFSSTHPYP